eukprot:57925-Chlamydomonas_euryale.AAC.1
MFATQPHLAAIFAKSVTTDPACPASRCARSHARRALHFRSQAMIHTRISHRACPKSFGAFQGA